jgi:Cft2 family RNA processing exonuclease
MGGRPFYDAGHVFGASMIKRSVDLGRQERTVIFSSDVGRWDRPILRDPTLFDEADYVVVESTYGDSLHESTPDISDQLTEVINATSEAGGNVVVPSFALKRAQEVLYHLNLLVNAGRIPQMKVFLDSPMAASLTEIFERHPVRARVAQIHGFSAHADRDDLIRWLSALKRPPRCVFVTHGEPETTRSFGALLRGKTGWSVSVPEYGKEVILD